MQKSQSIFQNMLKTKLKYPGFMFKNFQAISNMLSLTFFVQFTFSANDNQFEVPTLHLFTVIL